MKIDVLKTQWVKGTPVEGVLPTDVTVEDMGLHRILRSDTETLARRLARPGVLSAEITKLDIGDTAP